MKMSVIQDSWHLHIFLSVRWKQMAGGLYFILTWWFYFFFVGSVKGGGVSVCTMLPFHQFPWGLWSPQTTREDTPDLLLHLLLSKRVDSGRVTTKVKPPGLDKLRTSSHLSSDWNEGKYQENNKSPNWQTRKKQLFCWFNITEPELKS